MKKKPEKKTAVARPKKKNHETAAKAVKGPVKPAAKTVKIPVKPAAKAVKPRETGSQGGVKALFLQSSSGN